MSKYVSLTMLSAYIIVSIYKIFLLVTDKSIYWFAISNALDYAIIALTLLIIYKIKGEQKLTFSVNTAKNLFSKGNYYIVSSMMVTIFAQTARIMLKFMLGNDAVGYYSAAVACAGMSAFVFSAIIDSARPMIFESKKSNQASFENNMIRLYSVIIYLALIQCVFIALFSNIIVKILYGNEYLASVTALRIIVWYTTFSYIGPVRNIWILAEDKHSVLWIINLLGAIANIGLNFILIPIWGVNGAALAAVITQFFTNFILGYIIKPIRYNNFLMIKGLNIKYLFDLIKRGIK
jgi:O-antigen/teichoic acid export membrane protein